MKLFKYIFYRIYSFYIWKWPYSDGAMYAGTLVIILPFIVFYFGLLDIIVLCFDVTLPHSKYFRLVFFFIIVILEYYFISKNDKYLAWLNAEDYKSKWYLGWRGNFIMFLFFVVPIITIFASKFISSRV